ncbi:MAG: hypothetical protein NVSMB65_05020 [Chloroflexota bacterium]
MPLAQTDVTWPRALAAWLRHKASAWTQPAGGDVAALLGLLALAALFRVVLLATVFAHIDSDQAVLGLMAFHIQAGDRPIFYYGQPYMGSLEAYLAAIVFALWGASEWTVRLPALCFSLAFVGAVYALGRTLYGRWIGFLAGLFVACGPAILINWSTAAGAGYIEAMVCGTVLLVLAARYPDPRALPLRIALLAGMLAGLGLWMEPMIVEYVIPLGIAYIPRLLPGRHAPPAARWVLLRSIVALAVGAAVGAAPLLAYNVEHRGATLTYLTAHAPGGDHLAVAGRLVTQTLPILLGFVTPTTVQAVFARLVAAHPLFYLVGVVAGAAILARLLLDPRGLPLRLLALVTPQDRRRPADGTLALFALGCLVFFLFTHYGAIPWATHLPRYLIPLYTATPLVLDVFIPRNPSRGDRWVAAAAVATLIAASLTVTLAAERRTPIDGLVAVLSTHHVRIAYTNYWLAERLTFATHEHITGIAVTDSLSLADNRVPSASPAARGGTKRPAAWIFARGSRAERSFVRLLHRRHVHARRLR